MRVRSLTITVALGVACTSTSPAPAQQPQSNDNEPSRAVSSSRDAGCEPVREPERIEIAIGTTQRAADIAITYESYEHDHFDDGKTDELVRLRFNGIMEDGSLTPSALGWMPSLHEVSQFVYLRVNRCVRLVEGSSTRVVVDVFKPR